MRGLFDGDDCVRRVFREYGFDLPVAENLIEDASVCGVVIDDQNATSGEARCVSCPILKRFRCGLEVGEKMKRAAAMLLALDPDLAVHELDQSRRNGEP